MFKRKQFERTFYSLTSCKTKYQFRNVVKYINFSQNSIYTQQLLNDLGWFDKEW